MKKTTLSLLAALLLASCQQPKETLTLTVNNPLAFDRSEEVVEVEMAQIEEKLALKETDELVLTDGDGQELAYQLTHDGKLIFLAEVPAQAEAVYSLRAGNPTVQQTTIA